MMKDARMFYCFNLFKWDVSTFPNSQVYPPTVDRTLCIRVNWMVFRWVIYVPVLCLMLPVVERYAVISPPCL